MIIFILLSSTLCFAECFRLQVGTPVSEFRSIASLNQATHREYALSCRDFMNRLQRHYPNAIGMDEETLKKRMKSLAISADAHGFFRAFPQLNLMEVKANPSLQEFSLIKGLISGDPHIENFGTLDGKLGVNDFDDIGFAPVYADLLRYLSSVMISSNQLDIDEALASYKRGLEGKYTLSELAKKRINKAKKGRDKPKDVEKDERGVPHIVREYIPGVDEFQVTNSPPRNIVAKVRDHYPNYKIVESYQRQKYIGGSGGLKRYYFLMQSKENPEHYQNIEFKPLELENASSIFTSKKTYAENFQTIMSANKIPLDLKVVKMSDGNFLLKKQTKGNKSYHPGKYETVAEKKRVLLDQLALLGEFHRNNLTKDEFQQYSHSLSDLDSDSLESARDLLVSRYLELYQSCQKLNEF
jgi:hypothetical protein